MQRGNGKDKAKQRVTLPLAPAAAELPAGAFSPWLEQTRAVLEREELGAYVPCGSCSGCCRGSMFIHIRPEETDTLAHIPGELLFPAPGAPPGHVLMGYDAQGRCPMLDEDRCTIYEHRPRTCRDFDCRIFAATGIAADPEQTMLAERARAWRFEHPAAQDERDHAAVRAAAAFLAEHAAAFPDSWLPRNPVQLAVLAIDVSSLFTCVDGVSERPPAELARAVMEHMEAASGRRRGPRARRPR
jgi:Fe-S-cluster containining protein